LNFRKNLIRTNHHNIEQKKWIFNPKVYTREEFDARIKAATEAPWKSNKPDSSNKDGEVGSVPINIGNLID
jgi:hypothetical protein